MEKQQQQQQQSKLSSNCRKQNKTKSLYKKSCEILWRSFQHFGSWTAAVQPLVLWVPWTTNLSLHVLCKINSILILEKKINVLHLISNLRSSQRIQLENNLELFAKYIFLPIFNSEVERPREIALLASYQEAVPVFLGECLELLKDTSLLWPRPS